MRSRKPGKGNNSASGYPGLRAGKPVPGKRTRVAARYGSAVQRKPAQGSPPTLRGGETAENRSEGALEPVARNRSSAGDEVQRKKGSGAATREKLGVSGFAMTDAAPDGDVLFTSVVSTDMLPTEVAAVVGTASARADLIHDGPQLIMHVAWSMPATADSLATTQHAVASINLARAGAHLASRIPVPDTSGFGRPGYVRIDAARSRAEKSLVLEFGPRGQPKSKLPSGNATWRLARVLKAGANWSTLVPDEFAIQHFAIGKVARGPVEKPGKLLGQPFELGANTKLQQLCGADADATIHCAVYDARPELAVVVGPSEAVVKGEDDSTSGFAASINLETLLAAAKKLGGLGKKLFDKLGGGKAGKGGLLEKLKEAVLKLVGKLLQLRIPGVGHIGFDLGKWIPKLASGSGFDWSRLLPDQIDLNFGGMGAFRLPALDFSLENPLANMPFPSGLGGKLHGFLSGLVPDLPNASALTRWLADLRINLVPTGGLGLGFVIDIGAMMRGLIPDWPAGNDYVGMTLDLDALLKKAGKAGQWLLDKLSKGGDTLRKYVHLGSDLVLRIYEEKQGNMVGFDLKPLLGGKAADTLTPIELHLGADELGEVNFGRRKGHSIARGEGGTLVARPGGKALTEISVRAPEVLQEQLGVSAKAKAYIWLYLDKDQAHIFASIGGSPKGLLVSINHKVLMRYIGDRIPIAKGRTDGESRFISKSGYLGFAFGDKKGKGVHGQALWRLDRFLQASTLDLEALAMPDELSVSKPGVASVKVGLGILRDKAGKRVAGMPLLPTWLAETLDSKKGALFYAKTGKAQVFSILAVGEQSRGGRVPGVELSLDAKKIDALKDRALTRLDKVRDKVLKRHEGASRSSKLANFQAKPVGSGLRVGPAGRDNIYVEFDYLGIAAALMEGDGEAALNALIPTGFAFSTDTIGLKMETVLVGAFTHDKDHKYTRNVGTLPALIKGPLGSIGLGNDAWLRLDENKSFGSMDGHPPTAQIVGQIYQVEDGEARNVKQLSVTVQLAALLEAVVPKSLIAKLKRKKPKKTKPGLLVEANLVEKDGDIQGVSLWAKITRKQKKSGKKPRIQSMEVTGTWNLDSLLRLLITAMGDDTDFGELMPDVLTGRVLGRKFYVDFTAGAPPLGETAHTYKISDLPYLPEVMEAFMSKQVVDQATLKLTFPGFDEVMALIKGGSSPFVELGGAQLSVGGKTYRCAVGIHRSMLLAVLGAIPNMLIGKKLRMLKEVITDPKGAAEGVYYATEGIYHLITAERDKFGDDVGIKEVALLMALKDPTMKQNAYAARAFKKLRAAGMKPGTITKKDLMAAAGRDSAKEFEVSNWIQGLSDAEAKLLIDLMKTAEKHGIKIEAGGEFDPAAATQRLREAHTSIALMEAGYIAGKTMADADELEDSSGEVGPMKEAARKRVRALLAAGVRPLSAPKTPLDDTDESRVALAELEQGDVDSVKGFPKPTTQQNAEANQLFNIVKHGGTLTATDIDQRKLKFSWLTSDELIQVHSSGVVVAERDGKSFTIHARDDVDRGFVLGLLMLREPDFFATVKKSKDGIALDKAWDAYKKASGGGGADDGKDTGSGGDKDSGTGTGTGSDRGRGGDTGTGGGKGAGKSEKIDWNAPPPKPNFDFGDEDHDKGHDKGTSGSGDSDRDAEGGKDEGGGGESREGDKDKESGPYAGDPAVPPVSVGDSRFFTRWDHKQRKVVENTANTGRYEGKVLRNLRTKDGHKVGIRAVNVTFDDTDLSSDANKPFYKYTVEIVYQVLVKPDFPLVKRVGTFYFEPPKTDSGTGKSWSEGASKNLGAKLRKLIKLDANGSFMLKGSGLTLTMFGVRVKLMKVEELRQIPLIEGEDHRLEVIVIPTEAPPAGTRWLNTDGKWEPIRIDRRFTFRLIMAERSSAP